jgi:hypothetical protein
MSAESTVAFFGIKIDVPESEVAQMESRQHPLIARARAASLQYYWGNFGGADPRYLFLAGRKLAILGLEDSSEFQISSKQLLEVVENVQHKLQAAEFAQTPELILQLMPST